MPAKRAKEIALAFPRGAHQEVFITGVLRYSTEHSCNWSYITSPESLAMSVLDLKGWRGDGIIAALNTPSEAACGRGKVEARAIIADCGHQRLSVGSA